MFKQVFTSSRNTSLIQVYEGVRVQHTPDGQSDAPVVMFKTLVSSDDIHHHNCFPGFDQSCQ